MTSCFSCCFIFCLSVVSGYKISLLPGDQVNLKLLEELFNDKNWTIFIDELMSNITKAKTMELMYQRLAAGVSVAKD